MSTADRAYYDEARRAVALLVRAMDRAEATGEGRLLQGIPAPAIYAAAVTVLLRLVTLAWAVAHDVPLLDSAAANRVRALFQPRDLPVCGHTWAVLVAAFGAVHRETGYGLFDPARYPFLDGETSAAGAAPAAPLPVGDETALRLLDAAGRYVATKSDVTAIGGLYEALRDHSAARAAEPLVGLHTTGRRTVEVPLRTLEETGAQGIDILAAYLARATGRSTTALRRALASRPITNTDETRLRAACDRDEALRRRVRPFAALLADDAAGYPAVVAAGRIYVTRSGERRAAGAHYTPAGITTAIVEAALEPLVYDGTPQDRPNGERRVQPAGRLLELKVCDLAMGSGAFLVAACRYLADRVVEAWATAGGPDAPLPYAVPAGTAERQALARRLVAERCLYGVDVDPLAVELGRVSLAFLASGSGHAIPRLEHALRCGDALVGIAPGEEDTGDSGTPIGSYRQSARRRADLLIAARLAGASDARFPHGATPDSDGADGGTDVEALLAGRHPFHWPLEFPLVCAAGGFDAIIGNPPFGNAIEHATARDPAFRRLAALSYDPFARGAGDYCLLFWARALLHLLALHGTYGWLSPTALLSDLKPWQRWVHAHARPTTLISYPVDRFPTARIRVTGYCGRRGSATHVRAIDHGERDGEQRERVVPWAEIDGCWFEALAGPDHALGATCRLADLPLTLHAGCATATAYDLAPLIVDDEHGRGPRLVTTGAVERYRCTWGQGPTRYLGRDYQYPRWPDGPEVPATVARARERQRSPMIIVGGLTAVLEAVFDPRGELAGVVSTWVLHLPATLGDDGAYIVLAFLNSATFSRQYARRYGGKSMSGRQMTIQKAALLEMRCPAIVRTVLGAATRDVAPEPGLTTAPAQLAACREGARLLQAMSPDDPRWPRLDKSVHLAAGLLYGRAPAAALDDYHWWCRQTRTRPDDTPVDALADLTILLFSST